MDLKTLERLVRAGEMTVEEVLAHAGVDRLDQTVTMLRRHRAAKEVCAVGLASRVFGVEATPWSASGPLRVEIRPAVGDAGKRNDWS